MGDKGIVSELIYGQNAFRYHIIPAIFLVIFTCAIQVLAIWGQGKSFSLEEAFRNLKGDTASWLLTVTFYSWAWLWIKFSNKFRFGPETSFQYKPKYADNGFLYFLVTMGTFLVIQLAFPGTSFYLYEIFPKILGVSNTLALLLCIWLYIKGKMFKANRNDVAEPAPILYEFYRGMELHARTLGVDTKQFTNCRVGMMMWPIFVTAFVFAGWQRNGFNIATAVNLIVQVLYCAKFYWWEASYFATIDMMTDRAGWYLCWGCLVFLPSYFCFPLSYVVTDPPNLSYAVAISMGIITIAFTFLEYHIDQQRHEFRKVWPKKYLINGKPAKFIIAEYIDAKKQKKNLPLLTSGYWGLVRHPNYTIEIIISFFISATLGFSHGLYTFAYFLFIFPLLIHRNIRDDEKCSKKYGKDWLKYKREVPYVLIPGVY